MKPADIMLAAAMLLLEDADLEQASCAVGKKQWACPDCKKSRQGKCDSQHNVAARRKVAAALGRLAKGLK